MQSSCSIIQHFTVEEKDKTVNLYFLRKIPLQSYFQLELTRKRSLPYSVPYDSNNWAQANFNLFQYCQSKWSVYRPGSTLDRTSFLVSWLLSIPCLWRTTRPPFARPHTQLSLSTSSHSWNFLISPFLLSFPLHTLFNFNSCFLLIPSITYFIYLILLFTFHFVSFITN